MQLELKYYVGTESVFKGDWARYGKATLDDAVKAAQERMARDPRLQNVSIAMVVAVVRRSEPPVTVEMVD